jgi:TetR/AcrR family transcriptional regulator, lmrAB and yxaGH operons repressor
MANSKVSKEDVLNNALELFRTFGFEGVSLNDISKRTGLEKPSLYFKFPGGKEAIALDALGQVVSYFSEHVFAPLKGPDTPRIRLLRAAEGLRRFYSDGTKSCVLDSLSLSIESPKIAATLNDMIHAWLGAFAKIAEEDGSTTEESKARAQDAIITLQGSLILARVLMDSSPFERALMEIPGLLLRR